MSDEDVRDFLRVLGSIVLYSVVAVVVAMIVFEVLNRRYQLMREVLEENNTAAGVLAGAFVLGIFYTIAVIVVS